MLGTQIPLDALITCVVALTALLNAYTALRIRRLELRDEQLRRALAPHRPDLQDPTARPPESAD